VTIAYDDADASNGSYVTGFDALGSSISFVNKNGASSIVIRYKSDVNSELSLNLSMQNNVDHPEDIKTDDIGKFSFPATGGSYKIKTMNVNVVDAMTVTFKKDADDSVDSTFKMDSIAFSDKYEAEAAELVTPAEVTEGNAASNGQFVRFFGGDGSSVTFENVKAGNQLNIGYTCESVDGNPGIARLYMAALGDGDNFVYRQDVTFKPTGSWDVTSLRE
jgi:trimeric autotransporter adhesin